MSRKWHADEGKGRFLHVSVESYRTEILSKPCKITLSQRIGQTYTVSVMFDPQNAFSHVCCSVFKQKHDGPTLKVKISVRRSWSRESLTPWGITHQPLSHKYRTISSRMQVERRRSCGLKGCREKQESKENIWSPAVKGKDVLVDHTWPQWLWSEDQVLIFSEQNA